MNYNEPQITNASVGRVASNYGEQGRSCSEAIMLAFIPSAQIKPAMFVKLASGLGGGVGQCGEICGTALAACLVIGALCGTDDPKESHLRQRTYLMVQAFLEKFRNRFGSVVCLELCYAHLGPEDGFAKIHELDLVREIIHDTAEMLEALLAQVEDFS